MVGVAGDTSSVFYNTVEWLCGSLRSARGQGLRLAAIGIASGVILAWVTTRALSSLLYGVKPTDPWTIALAALILLAAVAFASLLPARNAALVDPLLALRRE